MSAPTTSRGDSDQMSLLAASAGTEVAAAAGEGEAPVAAVRPRVIGVDLSLTSTGVAGADWATTIAGGSLAKKGATLQQKWTRICRVRGRLLEYLDSADLVVIEGPAFASNDPGAHERAALWWRIVGRCLSNDVPVAVVPPSTLKVYATGNGRASKEDVVQQVQRRWSHITFRGNDQADAIALCAMGLDHLGHPTVELPQTHRRALVSVTWPELRP